MKKIDLITGFLGSGKTTFLKKYARYLMSKGYKVGILENDYGAVNVDMMLLQDIQEEGCELEMVAGGCDADCHRRRFKTKLIAMGMSDYDRVLVEPSGIFDVDEFFDALYEEPLSRWYEIGNVIAIVDANLEDELSAQSEFLLASQIADAGAVILSKTDKANEADIEKTIEHMNKSLEKVKCRRSLIKEKDIIIKDWESFDDSDYESLLKCGYVSEDYVKTFDEDNDYNAVYIMNEIIERDKLEQVVSAIMTDKTCGNVFRIKGFMPVGEEKNTWVQINATAKDTVITPIPKGQEIIIVIGEELNEARINEIIKNN